MTPYDFAGCPGHADIVGGEPDGSVVHTDADGMARADFFSDHSGRCWT